MNTALIKINARVKELQKKHPNSERITLQKQAGKEWRDGKLKKRKPSKRKVVAKLKPVKRRRAVSKKSVVRKTVRKRRAAVAKSKRVYRAKVVRVRAYKAPRYKRISGIGKMSSLVPIVAVVGLGILAYYFMNKTSLPAIAPTTNPQRAAATNDILQWAAVAGLTATAIAKIIDSLNNSSDDAVVSAAADPAAAFNPMGIGI
jgi:hypothetical protein